MLIDATLLQFLYSVVNSSIAIILAGILLYLNIRYGDHDFRYFSRGKTLIDLASTSFLKNLAIKRKTQNFMVCVLLVYVAGNFVASYTSALLSFVQGSGLANLGTYEYTVKQQVYSLLDVFRNRWNERQWQSI